MFKQQEGLSLLWICWILFIVKDLIYWTLSPLYIPLFTLLVFLPPVSPLFHLLKKLCFLSFWFIDSTQLQSFCILSLKFSSCLVVSVCLNAYYDNSTRQLLCTDYLHSYNRIFPKGIIWCKNNAPPLLPRTNQGSVFIAMI